MTTFFLRNTVILKICLMGLLLWGVGCDSAADNIVLEPLIITELVPNDTDDPAIWIHPTHPESSLVIGTDKEEGGGLYVYDLKGRIQRERSVTGLARPNNVDLGYGLVLGADTMDFVVTTERLKNQLRFFRFPEMTPIDNGGLPIFEGVTERAPMGVALYKRGDGQWYVIVSRKEGPQDAYLWQYQITPGDSTLAIEKVREFGLWSGEAEIEAIAIDQELGYVYYSDEMAGIRKYYADPDHPQAGEELAVFGEDGFTEDREGISIYKNGEGTGFILVSDQQANSFRIFPREGSSQNPHDHPFLRSVTVSAMESDGSEITNLTLGQDFPNGLFVAMSEGKVFHYYRVEEVLGELIK